MKTGVRYFAFSLLFLAGLSVITLGAPPEGSVGVDLLALAMTYGVILAILAGVVGAVGLIRRCDGEMDWGQAVAPPSPETASGSVRSARTVP